MAFEDDWSDSPPEKFDQAKATAQFDQYIFENWKRGEGPCRSCPNYAAKKNCFPATGYGRSEAEIVIVGNSPGPRDRELEIDNKKRIVDPDKLENHPEFDGLPLISFYNHSIEDLNSWRGFATLNQQFIENGLNTKLEAGTVYFTNAKKCVNIEDRDDKKAAEKCSSYLKKELAIVDPSIVISWGLRSAEGTAQAIEYEGDLPDSSTSLPSGDEQPTDSCIGYRNTKDQYPEFITMPHYSMLGSNCGHITGFDKEKHDNPETQLYFELADLVDYLRGE